MSSHLTNLFSFQRLDATKETLETVSKERDDLKGRNQELENALTELKKQIHQINNLKDVTDNCRALEEEVKEFRESSM